MGGYIETAGLSTLLLDRAPGSAMFTRTGGMQWGIPSTSSRVVSCGRIGI